MNRRFTLAFLIVSTALVACEEPQGGLFTEEEWDNLESLANLPPPTPDPANKYVGDGKAEILGQKLYFDTRVSGTATQVDTLGRSIPQGARAPKGSPINMSCATCHDPAKGGSDSTSVPGHVSVGAGWYDVNSQPSVNSAYYDLKYWNGRYDSLVWQILAVAESGVSLNGNRVQIARLLHDKYRTEYEGVFTEHPLPDFDYNYEDRAATLEPDGQCTLNNGTCPTGFGCSEDSDGCWPRFPLQGKPGKEKGCQRGSSNEPFGDAFDCMDGEDQALMTRTYVNFAKAIASYEFRLVSGRAPFDRFVDEGPDSEEIPPAAKRGAKLFVGKASCIECHNTPLFSDSQFYNIGVPQTGIAVPTEADCKSENSCSPYGFFVGLQKLKAGTTFRIDSAEYSDNPNDRSRQSYYAMEVTDALKGAWRTPTLRDVVLTAPYMHNGFYKSLEEVVRHYDGGGTQDGAAPQHLDVRIAPIGLSDEEIGDLVAFMQSLTGEPLPTELVVSPELP